MVTCRASLLRLFELKVDVHNSMKKNVRKRFYQHRSSKMPTLEVSNETQLTVHCSLVILLFFINSCVCKIKEYV